MDRIAVISDIHGNMPALDAVFADITGRGINRIFCLGDLVGKGPHSGESIDRIQQKCEVVVRGNWDEFITRPTEDEVIIWHQKRIGQDRMRYLETLPFSMDFYLSGRLVRLFHASAKSIFHRVRSHSAIEERLAMFETTEHVCTKERINPDIVGYGDVHSAFVQNFSGKTLFNAGSVGNPLDIPQAAYAILEGVYQSRELVSFSVSIVRIPYDVELSIEQAREEAMPDLEAYTKELRSAKYRGLKE